MENPGPIIRRFEETTSRGDMRDDFSIDVDRILHSRAYTSYIDKTQVFYLVGDQGISHRVIHVQLLSRIARTIGRKLNLNDDLVEAIAIGHDIGHPPFGHDGERYLDELCVNAGVGCFRHNIQGIRALEIIEKNGQGLNLTLEVLDGILCHNGEVSERTVFPAKISSFAELDTKMDEASSGGNPMPMTLEGCLVRVADTVSYIGRDIEDAIALGIVSRDDIPREIRKVLGDTNGRIVYSLVADLIENSNEGMISYSETVFEKLIELKKFNYERIYHNPLVKAESNKIRDMYALVFGRLVDDINSRNTLSPVFRRFLDVMDPGYAQKSAPEVIVRDCLASLTDSAFLNLFNELFVPSMNH